MFVLTICLINQCSEKNRIISQNNNNIEALSDSIKYYKDKDGLNITSILQLEFSNQKQFTELELKNKDIQKLQKLVKKYKKELAESGVAITGETVIKYVDKPIIIHDTITNDTNYVIDNEWINCLVNKNNFNLKVRNEFDIIIGKRQNKPFVDIKNYNPYVTTTSLRSVKFEDNRRKNWILSGGISYGFNGSKFTPLIGLSFGYKIIEF